MNVLFVCVANSGRSVMAERLFRQAAGNRHQARSAGSDADLPILLVGYLKAAGWFCRYYHCRDRRPLALPARVPVHG